MTKIIITSTAILIICLTSFAQTKYQHRHLSNKVKRLAQSLQKYNEVTGARIGNAGLKSDQYKIYEKLKLEASENELFELTNHKCAIVRAYAFTGLSDISSPKTLEVIIKNQNDTAIIAQQFGCLGSDITVIGYMLHFLKNYVEKNNVKLNVSQEELVDKLSESYLNWSDRRREKYLHENKND